MTKRSFESLFAHNLGEAIYDHRTRLNVSGATLGARCGLTRQAIHLLEQGESIPSLISWCKIATALGIPAIEQARLTLVPIATLERGEK